jgi:hypothetical protein
MLKTPAFLMLFASLAAAQQPLFRVLDINVGETQEIQLADGKAATVKLLALGESRDKVRSAIWDARVEIEINGEHSTLSCGNYRLPVKIGGVQADCAVTRAYYQNSNRNHWALAKDARLRVWPGGSPFMPPGSMVYPVRQTWFATRTQMANEPTYVDGESINTKPIYYHAGLDIGGAEGLVEVVAATSGIVVARGRDAIDELKNNDRFDVRHDGTIYVRDERGWYHRYSHLDSFDPAVELGGRVAMGQKLGLLGKNGDSGGWSHLHYEILSPQASGKWGTLEGYGFLWEAYQRQYKPHLIAVARPHQSILEGEKALLDGSRSWGESRLVRYEWTFTDGEKASGAKVDRTYVKAGTYSEILKVTDDRGRVAYDFETVDVLDPQHPDHVPPGLQAAYWPTTGIAPGKTVTFKVRAFKTTDGEEHWFFGDGSTAETKSDGDVEEHAKNGFAVTTHAFSKPGDHIVRVERANQWGQKAITHLWVHVGDSR